MLKNMFLCDMASTNPLSPFEAPIMPIQPNVVSSILSAPEYRKFASSVLLPNLNEPVPPEPWPIESYHRHEEYIYIVTIGCSASPEPPIAWCRAKSHVYRDEKGNSVHCSQSVIQDWVDYRGRVLTRIELDGLRDILGWKRDWKRDGERLLVEESQWQEIVTLLTPGDIAERTSDLYLEVNATPGR
jgi:hypothetical protein